MYTLLLLFLSLLMISCDTSTNNSDDSFNPNTNKNVEFKQVGTGDLLKPYFLNYASDNYRTVVHNDSIWSFNTKYSYVSPNGEDWIDLNSMYKSKCPGVNLMHALFSYNGKIWLVYENFIYNTTDAITWDLVTSECPADNFTGISHVIFKNKIWIIGGKVDNSDDPEIWNSSDGINWTLVTDDTGFKEVSYPGTVVFNERIWIIGGYKTYYDGQLYCSNEIWSSSDGINWEESNVERHWEDRYNFGLTEFNDTLWMAGGSSESIPFLDEVWFSPNGYNWYKSSNQTSFSGRTRPALINFKNAMWLIAGEGPYDDMLGDVWKYQ